MSDNIIPIVMPKWGLSMKQGTLVEWHIDEGDTIEVGQEIMDVETDKIAAAVEAPDPGILRRKVAEVGEIYTVQALLGVIAPDVVSDSEIDAYIAGFEVPEDSEGEESESEPAYQFLELAAGKLRYAKRDGEGTPILLVHGFGGDLDNWLFNIDAFSQPVYALDLPGHGQSFKTLPSADLNSLVSAVFALMEDRELERVNLVGHSMGGAVCASLAAKHPQRVSSVTLISPAGFGDEINGDYIEGFVSATSRRELTPVLKLLFADPSLVTRAMADDMMKYKRLDGVQDALTSLSKALFESGKQRINVPDLLASTGIPVQVIWGEKDTVIPASQAVALPGASVTTLPNAGHMAMMEEAGEVNKLIAEISR
ncbi:acetoin dehydrogenase dihydrolipoyllysine-residue acetyltransferase subunit [Parasalinivibrio latis]|uniref:acetoin dehydrogenase dihydrolipoyllysine-residue acetyltransferase subunit n=1 Tax=Parasalinivibrio latis TaxID=2952610 RepID=UPI0030DEF9E0